MTARMKMFTFFAGAIAGGIVTLVTDAQAGFTVWTFILVLGVFLTVPAPKS